MGTSERAWDAVWLTLFAAVLVGALNRLLPSTPALQLAVVPAWLGYWMATRGPRLGAWVAIWGGALLECDWDLPPGTCILFLLMIWGGIRLFRDNFPETVGTLHGLLWGVALVPIFLYNGEKGRSPKSPAAAKAAQLGFYLFYPVHLLLLWALW